MSISLSLFSTWKWHLLASIQTHRNRRRMRQAEERERVFCVGLNKTGTTSWAKAMTDLGYIVGSETKATMLYYDWVKKDFSRIIEYCRTDGQAFQDFPFSLPGTYREMDHAFLGSKFILTVRDSAEQWYESLINFHGKYWSSSGHVPPTAEDLVRAVYWRRGLLANYCCEVFKTPISDPYNRDTLLDFYQRYNWDVKDYFANRASDFIILNVGEPGAYNCLREFLGMSSGNDEFPWINKN